MGNSGSGKSTLARILARETGAAVTSLDEVAFVEGARRRPLAESIALAQKGFAAHENVVLEGCYADIIAGLLEDGDELIFLNPGVEACVAHCRARPWEPDKYATAAAQDANLEMLIGWVRSYAEREDEYGLAAHRAVFDAFPGSKMEFTHPEAYSSD